MPITATSQYALKKLNQQDPAFTKNALSDLASGDGLALQALQEKTGLPEAELREAARLYVDHQLDALFSASADPRVRNTTGSNSASTFAPGAGGAVNNMIGLRGDAAATKVLAGALKLLVDERAGHVNDRDGIAKERGAKQTELDGLSLNRRERFMGGFFAGVLGADSKKAEKGKALREDIERCDEKIAELDGKIAGITGRMHETTAKHLRQVGDPTIKGHDDKTGRLKEMLDSIDELSRSIDHAKSAVWSAKMSEQQERMREANERNTPQGNQPHTHGVDFNAMWGASSVSSAENALRDVRNQADRTERDLRRLGSSIDVGTVDTTDTGDGWDNFMDMMGNHGSGWFFSGSTNVLMNLSRAEGELSSLESRVDGIRRGVASQHNAAVKDRSAYLDAIADQVL